MAGCNAAEERFLATVLHPLWDARLTVSHQVRTVDEFEGVDGDDKEDEDPEFTLALLDARLLAGDRGVFDRVRRRFGVHDSPERRTALLRALLRLTEARHASYNETIYQAEPDVKSSPGGLRDMTVVRLLARLVPERDLRRARPSTRPKSSCCASDRCCTSRPAAT